MIDRYDKFYRRLRARIEAWGTSKSGKTHRWLEFLLAAPDLFHLLIQLIGDRHVPTRQKAKLGIVIAYYISPLDIIPDFLFPVLGPMVFADDIVLSCLVLRSLLNDVDQTIVYQHWLGKTNILFLIQRVLSSADAFVGRGLFRKIRAVIFPAKIKK